MERSGHRVFPLFIVILINSIPGTNSAVQDINNNHEAAKSFGYIKHVPLMKIFKNAYTLKSTSSACAETYSKVNLDASITEIFLKSTGTTNYNRMFLRKSIVNDLPDKSNSKGSLPTVEPGKMFTSNERQLQ